MICSLVQQSSCSICDRLFPVKKKCDRTLSEKAIAFLKFNQQKESDQIDLILGDHVIQNPISLENVIALRNPLIVNFLVIAKQTVKQYR